NDTLVYFDMQMTAAERKDIQSRFDRNRVYIPETTPYASFNEFVTGYAKGVSDMLLQGAAVDVTAVNMKGAVGQIAADQLKQALVNAVPVQRMLVVSNDELNIQSPQVSITATVIMVEAIAHSIAAEAELMRSA
ncbi:MAG: hypothetical protein PHN49_02775, partial [Candidatus Omnitrophica bacterium]|nr:hypothetical protein [Candidatus Omnitrophota bacterium]